MTTLQFIGARRGDFTLPGPVTGAAYYVDVASGEPVDMDAADAEAVLKADPHLWRRAEPTLEAVIEAAAEAAEVLAAAPEDTKRKRQG